MGLSINPEPLNVERRVSATKVGLRGYKKNGDKSVEKSAKNGDGIYGRSLMPK